MILTADWHLTDNPADEYRWAIFPEIKRIIAERGDKGQVFILGDLCDKKDRHSAALVNRLVHELNLLAEVSDGVVILMGNHDEPLKGEPFWSFLNDLSGDISFITQPLCIPTIALLPFVKNPAEAWADMDWSGIDYAFMHQPVNGARGENGHPYEGAPPLPVIPRSVKIFSGDIHTPQRCGRVTYVGAPHHVKFGDAYECRVLIIDDNDDVTPVLLQPARKALLVADTLDDLNLSDLAKGDQVKVRFRISPADAESWPKTEAGIKAWAKAKGISVSSIEAIVTETAGAGQAEPLDVAPMGEEELLQEYLMQEGIDAEDPRAELGIKLLRDAMRT